MPFEATYFLVSNWQTEFIPQIIYMIMPELQGVLKNNDRARSDH